MRNFLIFISVLVVAAVTGYALSLILPQPYGMLAAMTAGFFIGYYGFKPLMNP